MEVINNIQFKVKRVKYKTPFGVVINSPDNIHQVAKKLIGDSAQENFIVFALDVKSCIIGYYTAAVGGIDLCPVDMRAVFRGALVVGASGVAVSHNHPSSHLKPSDKDIRITKQIRNACKLLDLVFIDHVIVSDKGFYSFRSNNPLEFEQA